MKNIFIAFFLVLGLTSHAQKSKCIYDFEEKTDSTYVKKTADYLMHEKDFVNTAEYLNFSLINSNGVLYLNVKLLQKSNAFISAKSFDTTSKIYLQLTNGKIYPLFCSEDANSNLVYDENTKTNIRILSGYFLFGKENFEDLKREKISLIRIKYATEIVDYVMKKELHSENLKGDFFPESYFINHLKCIE